MPYSTIVLITVYAPLALLLPTVPLLVDDVLGSIGRGRQQSHASEGMSAARRQCNVMWKSRSGAQCGSRWRSCSYSMCYSGGMRRGPPLRVGLNCVRTGCTAYCGAPDDAVGAMAYRRYFMKTSLRTLYFWSTLFVAVLVGQLFLILGWNRRLGIPDFIFAFMTMR